MCKVRQTNFPLSAFCILVQSCRIQVKSLRFWLKAQSWSLAARQEKAGRNDCCRKRGCFNVFFSLTANMTVDKAQLNNPSELSTIKTLCKKTRPNLLLYECWGSGTVHTLKGPSTLTWVYLSLFCLFVSRLDFLSLPRKLHIL